MNLYLMRHANVGVLRERILFSPILEAAREGNVTLLYSSHDPEHNNAVALKEFLEHLLEPTERASCLGLQ